MSNNLSKTLIKDSSWALMSQAISLVSSLIISFILPRFIGIASFGYWQLFMLYTSYVGILHFGFSDGLYIKLGGTNFKNLNFLEYSPQIRIIVLLQFFFSGLLCLYSYFFINSEPIKQLILYFLSIFIIIDNTYKILSYIFMATGEVTAYSKTVMFEKSFFSIMVLLFILFIEFDVLYIILLYIFCHSLVCYYSVRKYNHLFLQNNKKLSNICNEIYNNCRIGLVLMISNIMATLIVGSCKFIVERYWNIVTFSKLSFALTISTFLLFFISQVSYVLFPFLRKVSIKAQGDILTKATFGLTVGSFFAFCLIFPIYGILYCWLPKYHESLYFMTILAPVCIYEIRTNLLYNTFFKNLNRLKDLLLINIVTIIFAVALYSISVYYSSLDLIALSILCAIILRSTIMQLKLYRLYDKKVDNIIVWDFLFTIVVVSSFHFGGLLVLFLSYICFITIFSLLKKNILSKTLVGLKYKLKE